MNSTYGLCENRYNPYAAYSNGLYSEASPGNSSFYNIYYRNKMEMMLNKIKKDESSLFYNFDSEKDDLDTVNLSSPVIHPDSHVKNVFIHNNIRGDVHVRDED
jgi:hypothetical protein